jgi:hypothetical protein
MRPSAVRQNGNDPVLMYLAMRQGSKKRSPAARFVRLRRELKKIFGFAAKIGWINQTYLPIIRMQETKRQVSDCEIGGAAESLSKNRFRTQVVWFQ